MYKFCLRRISCRSSFLVSPRRHLNIFDSVENGVLNNIPIENIRNFSVIAHVRSFLFVYFHKTDSVIYDLLY